MLGPLLAPLEMKGSSPDAISNHQPQRLMGKQGRVKGAGGGISPAKQLSRSLAGAEQTVRIKISKYCTWTGPVEMTGAVSGFWRVPCPPRFRERSRSRRRSSC